MLTIITITKNDLEGFCRTIHSTQQLRKMDNIVQLVIDSSEQDISEKIVETINQEINIQYYYQKSQGISQAFNYGFELASDGWLCFLNGGDEIHPELDIELFLKIIQQSRADIIIFEMEYNTGLVTKRPPIYKLYPPVFNWIPHPATIIKKSVIVDQKGFKEKYLSAMDGELWFRLFSQNYSTDLISIPIVKFYEGGLSSNYKQSSTETQKIIIDHFPLIFTVWIKNMLIVIKAIIYHTKNKYK